MDTKYKSIKTEIINKYINMYEREIKDIEWIYNQCQLNKHKANKDKDLEAVKTFIFLEREALSILIEYKEGLEYWKNCKIEWNIIKILE